MKISTKIKLVLFFIFFSLPFLSAIDINGCTKLSSTHFGQTLNLTADITSGNWPSTGCFSLLQDFNSQSVTINCQDHYIDTFNTNTFFDLNNHPIDTITFIDCNIRHDQGSYFFNITRDVNYVNFLSSYYAITSNSASFAYFTPRDNSLDFNLNGTIMNASSSATNWGFNFSGGGDYNSFTIRDVNVSGTNTSGYSYFVRITEGSDINYLNLLNARIHISAGYSGIINYAATDSFIEYNFTDTNITYTAGVCPYYLFPTGGTIGTLNLRGLGFTYRGNSCQNCQMFNFEGSDVNYVNLIDSNLTVVDGSAFTFLASDPSIDFNFATSKITGGYIGCLFHPLGSNINLTLYIHDLLLDFNGWTLFFTHNYARTQAYIYDSNMTFYSSPWSYLAYPWDYAYLDIDLYNNKIAYNPARVFTQASAPYLDVNFNTTLNLNNPTKRSLLISDNGLATGGNRWFNVLTGAELCTTDLLAPLGICDNNVMIWGADKNKQFKVFYSKRNRIKFDNGK